MEPSNKPYPFHQAGFSLVEIMVGLAIGMFVSLVIMQVISVFEAQKRVTTGTADAQTNGSIALYNIGRELSMAGYPLISSPTNSPIVCTALTVNGVVDATTPNRISPVTIVNGASGASDTITIRYGNTMAGGVPTQITGMGAPTANDATVGSNMGCSAGDTTLIINGASCALSSATAVSGVAAPMTVTLADTTNAAIGANLACLGAWNEITYAVNNGNLERNGLPVMSGIVNLQAQYGVSATANSNQVTQWVDANGSPWAAPGTADRNRIKAVRIAVVARNAKIEASAMTAACSSTTAAAPSGLCAWSGSASSPAPAVNMSSDPNWARYRYRVFETIIPLRNVIWARETL